MTTYIMSKTREGLDAPDAISGPRLGDLAHTITDLSSPEWEGIWGDPRGFHAPNPGHEFLGWISAIDPKTGRRDAKIRVWVRAVADEITAMEEARYRLSEIDEERAAQITARDEAIRSALASGMPATVVSYHSGVSVPRVYQIRDGRR